MGILAAFLAEVGLVTIRAWKNPGPLGRLPLPATYAAAAVIYGLLGLAGRTQAEPVATAVAWGFVVATAFNVWTPSQPTSVGKPAAKPAPAKK